MSQSPFTRAALRVAAEMAFTDAPTVQHHGVAGLVVRMRRSLDRAREVDAGDHREASHDGSLAGDGKAVLVVDGRVADPDGDIAVHQLIVVEIADRAAISLLALVDDHRLERTHRMLRSSESCRLCRSASARARAGSLRSGR